MPDSFESRVDGAAATLGATIPTIPTIPTSTPSPAAPLRRAVGLLHINKLEALRAVLMGVIALGSSIALAAASAWLIARASEMPPVLQLSVATVGVRTFGIARGLFRYLERLASHSVALKGMANLRTEIYARLAVGRLDNISSLKRGDLLARVSKDVDDVGDLVVRGILPGVVAAILATGSVVFVGIFHTGAAVALAACILLAGGLAPWLAQHAAKNTERETSQARADMSALSHEIVTQSAEITVAGTLDSKLDELAGIETKIFKATDRSAKMEGLAQGVFTFALVASAFLIAVLAIPAVRDGSLAPVELAVIVLTPLAVFEVLQGLPTAAIQVHTSRQAATRIMSLLDDSLALEKPTTSTEAASSRPAPADGDVEEGVSGSSIIRSEGPVRISAQGLATGWPGHTVISGLDLTLEPGTTIGLVGASGSGKTTTLMTLAGLLAPHAGHLEVNGRDMSQIDHHELAKDVVFLSEDAHIFETTVYENLRVARGDLTRDEAHEALVGAGLEQWLTQLPNGMDTILGGDAGTVSGGERRRLLLARALSSSAQVILIDEPAEHLDPATADRLIEDLIIQGSGSGTRERTLVIATHRLTPMHNADEVLILQEGTVADRGHHSDLLERNADYREALAAESYES